MNKISRAIKLFLFFFGIGKWDCESNVVAISLKKSIKLVWEYITNGSVDGFYGQETSKRKIN